MAKLHIEIGRKLIAGPFSMLLICSASASSSAQAGSEFDACYMALRIAMDSRDPTAIRAMLTDDFRSVDISGKSEMADEMIGQLAAVPFDPSRPRKTTVISVAKNGPLSQVVQGYATRLKKIGSDGAIHELSINARSNDTWRQVAGKWLLAKTVTRAMSVTLDGAIIREIDLDK